MLRANVKKNKTKQIKLCFSFFLFYAQIKRWGKIGAGQNWYFICRICVASKWIIMDFFTSTVDLATEPAVWGNGKMVKLSFNWQITAAAPNVNMATTKTKQTEENNGGSTDMFDWHLLSSWIIQYGQHDGAVVQALDFEAVAPICVCVLTNLLALC